MPSTIAWRRGLNSKRGNCTLGRLNLRGVGLAGVLLALPLLLGAGAGAWDGGVVGRVALVPPRVAGGCAAVARVWALACRLVPVLFGCGSGFACFCAMRKGLVGG